MGVNTALLFPILSFPTRGEGTCTSPSEPRRGEGSPGRRRDHHLSHPHRSRIRREPPWEALEGTQTGRALWCPGRGAHAGRAPGA